MKLNSPLAGYMFCLNNEERILKMPTYSNAFAFVRVVVSTVHMVYLYKFHLNSGRTFCFVVVCLSGL